MTESTEAAPAAKKRSGGLSSMLIADLKAMATGMGIQGAGSMKKAQLVEAIRAAQGSRVEARAAAPASAPSEQPTQPTQAEQAAAEAPRTARRTRARAAETAEPAPEQSATGAEEGAERPARRRRARGEAEAEASQQAEPEQKQPEQEPQQSQQGQRRQRQRSAAREQGQAQKEQGQKEPGQKDQGQKDQPRDQREQKDQKGGQNQGGHAGQRQAEQKQAEPRQADRDRDLDDDDDEGGGRRNRRRRGRDRQRGQRSEPDTTILEDDVLVPAAGILDVLDNYAFVRTTGYLPGAEDVYVSLSMVKKLGLRPGDAVVGQVRHPREGERKEKFNPMVRIDRVNNADPEAARTRPDYASLTPVHPDERLRLETGAGDLVGRTVDLAAPVGKGQRGLVVSPAGAGKTTLLQRLAASISANNPECHLMVVLVDERPEEVTDFQRSVKGEVIASTFDLAPSDHTQVAELAVERAKRLVELGHDVVVLLDGLTRLARAYDLSGPAGHRGSVVDPAALHATKRFFGAARNIEDGGSLTILATAQVESGSAADEAIFEAFEGTANWELHLSRELAEKRLFPAIDLVASGTRREDVLLGQGEAEVVWKLRTALAAQDLPARHEQLLERLRESSTNIELLTRVQKD